MKKFFILIFLFVVFVSCAKDTNNHTVEELFIPAFGEDDCVEMVAWNIETFPRTADTESAIVQIIEFLNVDFFAVEEIIDEDAFNEMVDRLPGYSGVSAHSLANFDAWGNMAPAFIYDTSVIIINGEPELLFFDDNYAFPRAPLKVNFTYQSNYGSIDLTALILHLKAMGNGDSDELRRQSAMNQLKNYINERPASEEQDYVILGDWNSDYTQEDFLLTIFNQDAEYNLLTYDFYDNPQKYVHNATYPSYESVIDHIVITKSLEDQINIESIKTLRIDDYFDEYFNLVSDHRPVGFRFSIK